MKKWIFSYVLIAVLSLFGDAQKPKKVIWELGKKDGSPNEFALAPDGYAHFVERDFGYEDKSFVVGFSNPKTSIPYAFPGPVDTWGGTGSASGWRTNHLNICFSLNEVLEEELYCLVIDLADYAKDMPPLIKLSINEDHSYISLAQKDHDQPKAAAPNHEKPRPDVTATTVHPGKRTPKTLRIPVKRLRKGGNQVSLTIIQGSWICFDRIALEGSPATTLKLPDYVFIGEVQPADYELQTSSGRVQPLLVEAKYLSGKPRIQVRVDGKDIFRGTIARTNYVFECPMPAVTRSITSPYQILIDGKLVETGHIQRARQKVQTPADYVDTRIGSAHSRWMIAPGPWMPFSMVKISPDNQNAGRMAGYEPHFESIGTFSHIHEWTLSGLGIFATNGPLKTKVGDELRPDEGYRSRIDKNSETAPIGYYKALLTDYNIKAELTATTRCSFERFTFPKDKDSARILLDFHIPSETGYQLKAVKWRKISAYRVEGYAHQYTGRVWSKDADQDYTLHFVMEFDQPIQNIGYWLEDTIKYGEALDVQAVNHTGIFLQFEAARHPVVQVRMGISLVSIANAAQNLEQEITRPFGWQFDAVRQHHVDSWNQILNRVKITTDNRIDKIRFYNALYRSVCSRNTWSDVNGQWRGTDGQVHQLKGKDAVALGSDAFWNTFWNLNQVWNLITPEWSNRWVNSQLAMYDAYGWLAKGPAGMNYIPVMVAEHEIPQMVSAYQMGIRNFNADKLLEAAVKMQTTPGRKVFSGFAGNRDLRVYEKYQYVPADSGSFSNTMEYSFDDWTVGQLAKSLGKENLYKKFNARGYWWKNAMDSEGYCHMRLSNGTWSSDFDPIKSGANKEYVEANAWQMSYFVPQDVPALIQYTGPEKFASRLEQGFVKSEPWRYNGPNKQYGACLVNQGNQQSMHFAFLFNWAGKPWLTQKWSRSILDRYYGSGNGNAYLGDEDQGQMSAWFIMASIGLFQTDGGTRTTPIYEIGSPLFKKTVIDLGARYGRGKQMTIIAENTSYDNIYVQKAFLNGKQLKSFKFPASELLSGGNLKLIMGPRPNRKWGIP